MDESKDTAALIIFVKNAEKGKVKTRLAKTMGDEKALRIYLALLDHTRTVTQSVQVHRYLYYSNFIPDRDDWSPELFHKSVQFGPELGDRMSNAFKRVLQKHGRAIIIGSDCASLTPEILQDAYDRLNQFDFVIGPALDGGYYLLGMSDFFPEVFQNIAWSTPTVLDRTIQIVQSLGKSYYLLTRLSDIDLEEDWEKYGWKL